MLPYSTLRDFFRIPWVHDNKEAVHHLSNMFYLLIALYRSKKMYEYYIVRGLFFEMFDSFAIYGRSQAKDVLDDLINIPWFQEHHRDLYRLIATFKNITLLLHEAKGMGSAASLQQETNRNVEEFIKILKVLTNFNDRDESRINYLLSRSVLMDSLMSNFLPDSGVANSEAADHDVTLGL